MIQVIAVYSLALLGIVRNSVAAVWWIVGGIVRFVYELAAAAAFGVMAVTDSFRD